MLRSFVLSAVSVIAFLSMSSASLASDDGRELSFGNWKGVCDSYSCIAESNRDVIIDFDKDGWLRVFVPTAPQKAVEIKAIKDDLKIKLPDGSSFDDFKRFSANNNLRIYVPPNMQKKFVASKKFTVEGVGEFDIRNFSGFFEQGAVLLGINE